MFLGLKRLMEAITVAAFHGAAGKLIDDNDLTIFDDVIHVTLKKGMGFKAWVR